MLTVVLHAIIDRFVFNDPSTPLRVGRSSRKHNNDVINKFHYIYLHIYYDKSIYYLKSQWLQMDRYMEDKGSCTWWRHNIRPRLTRVLFIFILEGNWYTFCWLFNYRWARVFFNVHLGIQQRSGICPSWYWASWRVWAPLSYNAVICSLPCCLTSPPYILSTIFLPTPHPCLHLPTSRLLLSLLTPRPLLYPAFVLPYIPSSPFPTKVSDTVNIYFRL